MGAIRRVGGGEMGERGTASTLASSTVVERTAARIGRTGGEFGLVWASGGGGMGSAWERSAASGAGQWGRIGAADVGGVGWWWANGREDSQRRGGWASGRGAVVRLGLMVAGKRPGGMSQSGSPASVFCCFVPVWVARASAAEKIKRNDKLWACRMEHIRQSIKTATINHNKSKLGIWSFLGKLFKNINLILGVFFSERFKALYLDYNILTCLPCYYIGPAATATIYYVWLLPTIP